MIELLEQMPFKEKGGYVFYDGGGGRLQPREAKAKTGQRSGVTGWTLHDIRRTRSACRHSAPRTRRIFTNIIGHGVGGRLRDPAGAVLIAMKADALKSWAAHVPVVARTDVRSSIGLRGA